MDGEKEALRKLLVSQDYKDAAIEYQGLTVRIKYQMPTRKMRNEALELASIEYGRRYKGESGFLPTVFEREMAIRMIKDWNLPVTVALGWDQLPSDLGDKISTAIGIQAVLTGATSGATKNPEVVEAKNSPPPEEPQEPAPTTD